MKKLLISAAFALSLAGVASAQTSTSTDQVPPALPPVITTGSSTIDNQVKTLRKEYETKIKALQKEYLTKLKALIGERKQERKDEHASSTRPMMGTSTNAGPKDRETNPGMPSHPGQGENGGLRQVEGTSTVGNLGKDVKEGILRKTRRFLGF
jgi:hypothetical protein